MDDLMDILTNGLIDGPIDSLFVGMIDILTNGLIGGLINSLGETPFILR